MSASVVSLSNVRGRLEIRRWTNQDVAEIYRVADTLRRAGLPIDCEEGQTDEGDPWYAFCNANTGDVIVHFAFIDGQYLAEVSHLGVSFKGNRLVDIVNQFLHSYPVVLPSQQSAATRVWMHPASGFVAFIATLYFLLEMTNSVEAREAAAGITIEGEGRELDPGEDAEFSDELAAHYREQAMRSSRSDGGASSDAVRSVAVSASILIAGVLIDWHRSSHKAVTFDPDSILDAILTKSSDELGDAIILALRDMAGLEATNDAGSPKSGKDGSIRTAHLGQADGTIDALRVRDDGVTDIDEDGQLFLDLHGLFGDAGRDAYAEFVGDAEAGSSDAHARTAGGSGEGGEGRLADTIAVSVSDADSKAGVEGYKDKAAQPGDSQCDQLAGSSGGATFLDAAGDSTTVTLLESLGLRVGASGNGSDSGVDLLVKLIGKSPDASVNSSLLTPLSATTGDSGLSGGVSASTSSIPTEVAASTLPPLDQNTAPTPTSSSPNPGSGSNVQTAVQMVASQPAAPLQASSGNPVLPEIRDLDFSIFDPVEVVRLFVQTVDKVGFAHLDEIFYLYDAVAIATEPEMLEFEQVYLANGDEVNLLGQAETFDAIFEALA
ncbi:MAG: hypothetical protein APF80_14615 [Alphaproteobacteria bacterium BRH_c36]|nr:MAG: hypothetical protein APF80_14615 [Alphaproteobacteria bacterium BRH_c36]